MTGGQLRRYVVVPHTHWDREWYRPLEHFRLELGAVVDGVLDVLERDQSFTSFTLDGQAVVLEDYVEVRPENRNRLEALLGAGRLEVGPSYILPDEFLVGAEPLVRNLLLGREVCRRFGTEPSAVGYLPDSFGHPLQLPQILAGFGIETMIFSRGLGDELDDLGVVFRWRAPGGGEVLAFQQLPEYGNFAAVADADAGEARVRGILERFGPALERARVDTLLLCNGTDHRPITPQLPALCDELEQRFPGSQFTIGTYAEYVSTVTTGELPAYTGELVGSRINNVLRGVNSARLYIKQANERAEQRLLAAETLAAVSALHTGAVYPLADFTLAWRELLRCHPHDTICGCSCDEVHRDALVRYESLGRTLSLLEGRSVHLLGGDGAGADTASARTEMVHVSVVNLLPYARTGLVEHPGAEPALVELEGFGARRVELAPAPPAPDGSRDGAAIESERFRVEATDDATLMVVDKLTGHVFRHLHALEDEHDMGDLYNFCPVDRDVRWRADAAAVRVLSAGPVISELELRVEAQRPAGLDGEFQPLEERAPLGVRTVVRLVRGSGRIEFRTTVDNATRDHRLRVVFPVGETDGPVRAEGHFAMAARPLSSPPPRAGWIEPPDPTHHTLGAVAVGPLALLTRGLPEYEVRLADGSAELCLTLLRCVGLISQPSGVIATRPHGAGPQLSTPEGQCLGRHQCEYALVPGAHLLDDLALLRESQDYRWGFPTAPPTLRLDPPLRLEGDVVFSCLKGAEDGDGLILRCFNPAAVPATVSLGGEMSVSRTRLDETGEELVAAGVAEVPGYQIATLRLRRPCGPAPTRRK